MLKLTRYPEQIHETWEGNWSTKEKQYLLEFQGALPAEIELIFSRIDGQNTAQIKEDNVVSIPKSANGLWIYGAYCIKK